MVPFISALRKAGHEVAISAPESFRATAVRHSLALLPRPDLPPDRFGAVMARMAGLSTEASNRVYMREIFGRLNLEFGLRAAREAVDGWRPDLVLAEEAEVTSLAVAAGAGLPIVSVGIGLARFAAFTAAELREVVLEAGFKMPSPPPRLSFVPPTLDGPEATPAARFKGLATRVSAAALPDWWPGIGQDPIVYITLGSEAGRMAFFPRVVAQLYDSVAALPVRVLLTTGQCDESQLPVPPANVHVERWFPQDEVLAHAAAVVAHGGFGTMIGAIAAGVPSVNLPLFALDQHWNAARLAEVGGGLVVDSPDAVGDALVRVLGPGSTERAVCSRLAEEIAGLEPPSRAVEILESVAKV